MYTPLITFIITVLYTFVLYQRRMKQSYGWGELPPMAMSQVIGKHRSGLPSISCSWPLCTIACHDINSWLTRDPSWRSWVGNSPESGENVKIVIFNRSSNDHWMMRPPLLGWLGLELLKRLNGRMQTIQWVSPTLELLLFPQLEAAGTSTMLQMMSRRTKPPLFWWGWGFSRPDLLTRGYI